MNEASVNIMAPTIGTSISRVDGRAKVTGLAKYAGEFNVPNLAFGAVVTSTVTKGPHRTHRCQPGAGDSGRARRADP